MPRDGIGIYTTPPGTDGIPNQTISSSAYNVNVHDVEFDLNLPRPIIAGGTGAVNADDALTNLGAEKANQSTPNCGRLSFVSSTQLQFVPYNGNKIKINGVIQPIPNAGIAGLTNTDCFVNGVAHQTLTVSSFYRIYAFMNAGVMTADFSGVGHATSTTLDNEGTEIKAGDDTRTLIGLCFCGTGGIFINDVPNRLVRSWFNRARTLAIADASGSTTSAPLVQIGATAQCLFFEGEIIKVYLVGYTSGLAPMTVGTGIDLDGVWSAFTANWCALYGGTGNTAIILVRVAAEGIHYAWAKLQANGTDTASLNGNIYMEAGP
jgi:hypothetical protein